MKVYRSMTDNGWQTPSDGNNWHGPLSQVS